MYDDAELSRADADVAEALKAGLQRSRADAGALYQAVTQPGSRFDLRITTTNNTMVDYYGVSDIVYKGTTESFLTGPDPFNLARIAGGLDPRVTLNLGHATHSGQRLSTLVHEVGLHCTRLFGALTAVLDPAKTPAQQAKELETQYIAQAFSAIHHHIALGDGTAGDYYELKARVTEVLDERSKSFFERLFGANRWADLAKAFTVATNAGEQNHAKMYPHPTTVWERLEARAQSIGEAADEYNRRAAAHQGGLVAVLSSFTSLFGPPT